MFEGRDLGGLNPNELTATAIQFYSFARFEFPAPTGTLYYTDRPGGYTGDLGEGSGSVTWVQWDIVFQDISNSQQTIMDVASIDIANLNNVWSALVLNIGIEMRPVLLMHVWFDLTTGAVLGKPKLYSGRMELARIKQGKCTISLIPHRSGMSQMLPGRIIEPSCGLVYGDARTCQYPGPFTGDFASCDHSRDACAKRSNLLHFGGEDLIPKDKVIWVVREA